MISIVITAFKEPKTIGKALDCILSQDIKEEFELIVACPDKETKDVVDKFEGVKHFHDPGKGKSYALNLMFKELKGDILIFTDGDVFLGDNSVNDIVDAFKDFKVGCVSGRVVSQNSKDNMLGYWSHLLADVGAHRMRKELSSQEKFFECTGYLFGIRANVIGDIPLDVAEDSIIPFYFFKKGYKVKYVSEAKVFVKNPDSFKDWLKQRKRTAGAHSKLNEYEKELPKMKSFKNEVREGVFAVWAYPGDVRELYWTFVLIFARLYMWCSLFLDEKFKKKYYNDGWDRVESTK
ncbi:MAG: glycosyltransferase [Nanoarchaeota archaeon]|nr:glycosyltransferase [Nanoarchaeota archaeon]